MCREIQGWARTLQLRWALQDIHGTDCAVQAGVQNILKDTWAGRLYGEAIVSVLPVMKSVERNEAAHLGF